MSIISFFRKARSSSMLSSGMTALLILLLGSIFFIISVSAFANPNMLYHHFPADICLSQKSVTVGNNIEYTNMHKSDQLKPNQSKAAILLINNASKQKVLVDLPPALHHGASAGWASVIEPSHASLLAINRQHFSLACYNPKTYKRISCKKSFFVCELKPGVMKSDSGYWIMENIYDKRVIAILRALKR